MNKLVTFLFIFILSLTAVSAQVEDFSVSSPSFSTLCPCSGQGIPITLSNVGSSQSTYVISAAEAVADITSLSHEEITLQPGQSTQVVAYITSACTQQGTVEFPFFVSTENGLTKTFSSFVTFADCYQYTVLGGQPVAIGVNQTQVSYTPFTGSYDACAQEETVIPVLVQNNDQTFGNTYQFSFSNSWASLSPSEFSLNAGTSGVLLLTLNPGLEHIGKYNLTIESTTITGEKQQSTVLPVQVSSCYEVSLEATEHTGELCSGLPYTHKVTLSNDGRATESIAVAVSGEQWATVEPSETTLGAGESQEISLQLAPDAKEKGPFSITLETSSDRNITVHDSLTVSGSFDRLHTCYNVHAKTDGRIRNYYEPTYTAVTVTNTGTFDAEYTVEITGPDWVSVDEDAFSLKSEQKYTFTVIASPEREIEAGTYDAELTITSSNLVHTRSLKIIVGDENKFIGALKDGMYFLRYYLLVLMIIMVVCFFFASRIKKSYAQMKKRRQVAKARRLAFKAIQIQREQERKAEKKAAKQAKRKKRTPHQRIAFSLIILAAVFSIILALFPTVISNILGPYKEALQLGFTVIVGLLAILIILVFLQRSVSFIFGKKENQ